MIQLVIYGEDFEQDIRPLIKAFYPKEAIKACRNSFVYDPKADMLIIMELKPDEFRLCLIGKTTDEAICTIDIADRKKYRNLLARTLYDILLKNTKTKLPWGTLTGVRPVKLIYEMLSEGRDEQDISRYMKENYYCSDDKIKKGIIIAKKERELLKRIDYQNGYSLYIGIPFCPTTCAYCSFTSYPLEKYKDDIEAYLKALYKEMKHVSLLTDDGILNTAKALKGKKLHTVYVGGGTPTALNETELEQLLIMIKKYFKVNEAVEFCVEAGRPDSITKEKLRILKQHGVNRISINPQSMRQKTLDIIGRNHTASQIEEAFYMARVEGHDNINMDLILGLTSEVLEDVRYTFDRILNLKPDGITVHTLALKRAAKLNTHKELYAGWEASGVDEMYRITEEYMKDGGYLPYYLYRQKNMTNNLENVGYSKEGKEGIYNILIMEEKQTILALGAGASTKYVSNDGSRIERVENVKSLQDYINRIDEMINRKVNLLNRV